MKNRTVKVLRLIATAWIYVVIASVIIGSLGILLTKGVWKFWEIMSPFNFANFFVLIILLTPVFLLNKIADKVEKSQKHA